MEESVTEVEMMYIQNTNGDNYTIETMGRRSKNVKLNFAKVEGVEIIATRPLEIKSSFIQMAENQSKMWNMRLSYPSNFRIRFIMGKITIEVE
jgi:hypothetical protein